MLLQDKVAVITGGAQGIGLAMATAMVEAGAKVVISDIRKEAAIEASHALEAKGYQVMGLGGNVVEEVEMQAMIEKTVATFGSIDILINNAGIQYVAMIEEYPVEKFRQLIDIMITGPFITTKHAFPYMKKQNFGRIINIASVNGLIGFAGKSAYNSAKHGVIGLTKVSALEGVQHGITVNALCPGYVDTPLVRNQLKDLARTRGISENQALEDVILRLVPQKRLLDVGEIADYAVFLASDRAKSVTGQAVVMDGGYLAQ